MHTDNGSSTPKEQQQQQQQRTPVAASSLPVKQPVMRSGQQQVQTEAQTGTANGIALVKDSGPKHASARIPTVTNASLNDEQPVPVKSPYRHRSVSGNARSISPEPRLSDASTSVYSPTAAERTTAAALLAEPAEQVGIGETPGATGKAKRHIESTRTRVPVRSILKAAPAPSPKFSFRRDVINYVGESIVAAASSGGVAGIGVRHTPNASASTSVPSDAASPAASASSNPDSSITRSAFWKRIGGAVTAVAAQVPVPQAAARSLTSLAERHAHAKYSGSSSISNVISPLLSSADAKTGLPNESNPHSSTTSTSRSASETDNLNSLKAVSFAMSTLTVVYPISTPQPPGSEAATRRRVNKEYHRRQRERHKSGWSIEDLRRLYNDCCRTRDEPGIPELGRLLAGNALPKAIDLSNVPLTAGSVLVLSDLLSVKFGLKRLILENCGLDDETIKPILHALLVSGSPPTLSIANNKRLKAKGWRMISSFMSRASFLRYLDVSENLVDKRTAELLLQAVTASHDSSLPSANAGGDLSPGTYHATSRDRRDGETSRDRIAPNVEEAVSATDSEDALPPMATAPLLRKHVKSAKRKTSDSAVTSLRLEACSLKNPTLDIIAHAVRQSDIKHISLRKNRINHMGAVALALLIRDYELSAPSANMITSAQSFSDVDRLQDISNNGTYPLTEGGYPAEKAHRPAPGSPANYHLPGNSVTARLEAAAMKGAQRRPSSPLEKTGLPEGIHGASPTTTLEDYDETYSSFGPERNRGRVQLASEREAMRHAEHKLRLTKQIEALPRIGNLLTLDVRGNDIRHGVSYIAQVLKRNRTLRVLNLSENRIDVQSLLAIAEALKYNSTLETLDLSLNPCCGPETDGVLALRSAFSFNTSLKRIYLNATDVSSLGAISLAEFLPEVHNLIHLDLTDNHEIDIAAVMAMAAALKLNTSIRCLDLSIPPNEPEYARLSQDIMQSCIRNTELAQDHASNKGLKVARPIYKSGLAKDLKELENGSIPQHIAERSLASLPPVWQMMAQTAQECIGLLMHHLESIDEKRRNLEGFVGEPLDSVINRKVAASLEEMQSIFRQLQPGEQKDVVGALNSQLAILSQRSIFLDDSSPHVSQHSRTASRSFTTMTPIGPDMPSNSQSPAELSNQVPSPSFSIADSDESEGDTGQDHVAPTVLLSKGKAPRSLRLSPSKGEPPELYDNADCTSPRSPVEHHSRSLTLEEGEVFRKGTSRIGQDRSKTLLDVLDQSHDASGDLLKYEILDTPVEPRPRRASIVAEADVMAATSSHVDEYVSSVE